MSPASPVCHNAPLPPSPPLPQHASPLMLSTFLKLWQLISCSFSTAPSLGSFFTSWTMPCGREIEHREAQVGRQHREASSPLSWTMPCY